MYGNNGQPFRQGAQGGFQEGSQGRYPIGDIPPLPRSSAAHSQTHRGHNPGPYGVSPIAVGSSTASGHLPPGSVEVTGSVAQTRTSSGGNRASPAPSSQGSVQYKVSGPPNYVHGNSAYNDYYAQRPQYDHQHIQKPAPGHRGPPLPHRSGSAGSAPAQMAGAMPGAMPSTSAPVQGMSNQQPNYYQNGSFRPHVAQGRVPTPYMPAPRSENDLAVRFRDFDRNNSGRLDYEALKRGLRNGDDTPFDPDTVKVIMRMFDEDGDNAINFLEFKKLWSYLYDYREIFSKFDRDNSGDIRINEFSRALHAFGYRLSSPCIQTIFMKYSLRKVTKRDPVVSFDRFVLCCIHLLNITTSFKRFDYNRDGFATIGFEDYLVEVTMLRN